MGTVRRLAEEVGRGLRTALPKRRKTVVDKVALAVGAMIEVRTPNTVERANVLPLETERQDLREQGLQRLLKNPVRSSPVLRAPDRLDRLLVIMALAMHWCVRAGQEDARDHPTPLEKNARTNRPGPLDL